MANDFGMDVPGTSQVAEVKPDEILYSYARFTQKGRTIKSGQNLVAGQVMARETASKKWVAYDPGTNEIQQIAITGSPTGGTFTVTVTTPDGIALTTAAIAYNATAAAVRLAIEALDNVNPGEVTVAGGALPGTPITVEFKNRLGAQNLAAMTTSDSLTGGTTPASAVTTTQAGDADTGTGGSEIAKGILRQACDASDGDRLGNIVISGMVKYSKLTDLDQQAITDLNGRVDIDADYFSF